MHSFANEAQLRGYIKKACKDMAHIINVESSTGTGIPDANYCCGGHEGWMEFKIVHRRVRKPTVKVEIRPAQIAWITERMKNDGRVWLVFADQNNIHFVVPTTSFMMHLASEEVPPEFISEAAVYTLTVPCGDNGKHIVRIMTSPPS